MLLKTLRAGASAVKRALHPVRPGTDDLPFELENRIGKLQAGAPIERHLDIGIETTTGPLGQGVANAVGMALAERVLAATFNREGDEGCCNDDADHETSRA